MNTHTLIGRLLGGMVLAFTISTPALAEHNRNNHHDVEVIMGTIAALGVAAIIADKLEDKHQQTQQHRRHRSTDRQHSSHRDHQYAHKHPRKWKRKYQHREKHQAHHLTSSPP